MNKGGFNIRELIMASGDERRAKRGTRVAKGSLMTVQQDWIGVIGVE